MSGGGLTSGVTAQTLSVVPAVPNRYQVYKATTAQVAGVAFDVQLRAFDAYSNLCTNYTGSDTVNFAWTGATATVAPTGPENNLNPLKAAGASWSFNNGVANPPTIDQFVLYKKSDTAPTLDIVKPTGNSINSSNSLAFTTANNPTVGFTKILQVATANTAWTDEITTHSMTSDLTKQLWAHNYDVYGNYMAVRTVDWSGTHASVNNFLGGNSNVSTTTVDPAVTGSTGIVEIRPAGGGTVLDSTGVFTVTNSAATKLAITFNSVTPPVAASELFAVTVQALDAENNIATNYTLSPTLTFSWNNANNSPAPSNTVPAVLTAGARTFTAGQFVSGNSFGLRNATDSGVTLTVSGGGLTSGVTAQTLSVDPAAPAELTFSNPGVQTAGAAFGLTVTLVDTYANTVESNCGTLTVSSHPTNNNAPNSTGPDLPGAISGTGTFSVTGITLYKAGSNTLSFSACSVNQNNAFTVNVGTVNEIRLSTTDSQPGSHLGSTGCTSGTTITCPTLYAFGFDTWGNNKDDTSYPCPAWSITDNNGIPFSATAPTLVNGTSSNHSNSLTSSAYHINGLVTCTAGSAAASTTMNLTKINKSGGSYTFACGNWTCNGSNPEVACTVSNTTGYDTSAYTFSDTSVNNCGSGIASPGSCTATFTGTTGSPSPNYTVTATVSGAHNSFVNMIDPAGANAQGGANAPTCP